jgi:methionyl aminopeptidase
MSKRKSNSRKILERARPLRRKIKRRGPADIHLKSPGEIDALQAAGQLVADCFGLLAASVQPGAKLSDLDEEVESLIRGRGAKPLYKGYQGNPPSHPPFPGVICASVNHEICHGIPDQRVLAEGDTIGIDIGLIYEGWCGDACVTFPVGQVSDEIAKHLQITEEAMYRGIAAAVSGNRLYDIGEGVQTHAEAHGYSVVREWGGHGLGRELHEPPSVPHTGERVNNLVLRPGMVFTVEPMVNAGSSACVLLEDGWTVITEDGQRSAQFEHTIAVTQDGPRILSPWNEVLGRKGLEAVQTA